MPLMIKDNISSFFIHIPKCGGSSLERLMKNRGWLELLSIRGVHINQLKAMKCSPQHMHAELLKQIVCFDECEKVVSIIRDPKERLQSEYFWQLKQGITNLSPENWIDKTFEEYEKDPYIYDNHIRPQVEFIVEKTKTFKLEEGGVYKALDYISCGFNSSKGISFFSRDKNIKLKSTNKSIDGVIAFDKKIDEIYDFYKDDYLAFDYPLPV